ncbi:acyl carrier protein [Butyrivibrio sp. LB2008]|uniref:acyl carrier protein n=1 Tax=Butyrivibrio sp. LB2008 TaxID=1408305 RepID=UPI000479A454|nr:acyl carrier protein [Butyrivibrio sp. LB2008]
METKNTVLGLFEKIFKLEKPSEEMHFTELGAKSIDVMKLQIELKKQFGIKMDFRTLYSLGSVNAISEYICEQIG